MPDADYVIVGAGLTGATIARLLHDAGRSVLVLEARAHVGGNVADAVHWSGIRQNLHGPHYFRTSSPRIQAFVQRFASFYPFAAVINSQVGGELFPWPLHTATFERFNSEAGPSRKPRGTPASDNFEAAMLELVPPQIYDLFIRGYSQKQWGVDPATLDADLAKRIEIRSDDDFRHSKAGFQGLPEQGFSAMVGAMLDGIELRLSADFHDLAPAIRWNGALVYTGNIDRFFDYRFGRLPYRAQRRLDLFIPGVKPIYPSGQTNLPSVREGDHVRTIEWRHMMQPADGPGRGTLLTLEFPEDARGWQDAEYPFPSQAARALFGRYAALTAAHPDVLFCGRLGEYRYLDMDQAIARAMLHAERLLRDHPS